MVARQAALARMA